MTVLSTQNQMQCKHNLTLTESTVLTPPPPPPHTVQCYQHRIKEATSFWVLIFIQLFNKNTILLTQEPVL